MDTVAKRLVWARTKKGISQQELAKAVKVSQSTIGNLEAGLRNTTKKIAEIADVLDVNALWLASGVGVKNETLSPCAIRLAKFFDALPEYDQETIITLAKNLVSRHEKTPNFRTVEIDEKSSKQQKYLSGSAMHSNEVERK